MTASTSYNGPPGQTDLPTGISRSTVLVSQVSQLGEEFADIMTADGHIKIPEFRLEIFKMSVDGMRPGVGLSPSTMAYVLVIEVQSVLDHLEWLCSYRFLERLGKTRPQFYGRGKHAHILDEAYDEWKSGKYEETVKRTHWICSRVIIHKHKRKKLKTEPVLARCHINGRGVEFEVLKKGDMGRIPNVSTGGHNDGLLFTKDPYLYNNNVEMWKGGVMFRGALVKIEYLETKNVKKLTVWPPAVMLEPGELDDADEILINEAIKIVEPICMNGGWSLGSLKLVGEVEKATTDPRIMFHVPADRSPAHVTKFWVDRSTGVPELETCDTAAAKAVFDFPNVTQQLTAEMRQLKLDRQMDHQMLIESCKPYDELAYKTSKLLESVKNLAEIEEIRLRSDIRRLEEGGTDSQAWTKSKKDSGVMYQ